ncbi:MAG: porin [Thiomicrospira sp.]|jgi:predicted porin|nr:porin [Thiomicrospira sp.]
MKITFYHVKLYGLLFLGAFLQFLFFSAKPLQAQTTKATDSTASAVNFAAKLDAITDLYGSLRFKAGASFEGEFGIRDQSSRIGLKLRTNITKGIDAIGQLEVGVNIVGTQTKIVFSADPGGAVGELDNIFTSRIGWVGIDTKFGQLTWGKQWSVYYDIAQFTDAFYAFGGDATGAFAAGTDGSISGTGRPANAFQYRFLHDYFGVGFQVQNRFISPNYKNYADVYAVSLIIKPVENLRFGGAYSKVRDGIADPDITQPHLGDEAMIAGVQYDNRRVNVSVTASSFTNHEIDENRTYFNGYGVEFYTQYRFLEKWSVYSGLNFLQPKSDQLVGDYTVRYVDVGGSYSFAKNSLAFIEIKFDDSKNSDGTAGRSSIFSFGLYLGFEY